jgi:hypothetical protein
MGQARVGPALHVLSKKQIRQKKLVEPIQAFAAVFHVRIFVA